MFSSNTDRGIQNIGISESIKLMQIKYQEIIFQRYVLVRGTKKVLGHAEWSFLECANETVNAKKTFPLLKNSSPIVKVIVKISHYLNMQTYGYRICLAPVY